MPLVPTPAGPPYPTIGDVMNLARLRVDDVLIDMSGELLANYQPYTETMLNSAWRWLQMKCANAGIETPIREAEIFGLPAAAQLYPVTQAWVTWLGCSDGVNPYPSPALPSDLYLPKTIWTRVSGSTNDYVEIYQAQSGLPTCFTPNLYDWRQDGAYYYPNNFPQDWRIRYIAKRPNLILANTTDYVPIMYCEGPMSARIAYEFANLRGSAQAGDMATLAESEFAELSKATGKKNQMRTIRRRGYGRRGAVPYPVQGTGVNYTP